jgi:DNA (cytosine-5)-methyltransferase 1
LQPKVFLLENVKGIIQGNAKLYAKQIVDKMTKAGYIVQVFLLNAASMGVPQKRERVFFIGHKKEYNLQKLKLEFNENAIPFGNLFENIYYNDLTKNELYLWNKKIYGDGDFGVINLRLGNKQNSFTTKLLYKEKVCNTVTGGDNNILFDIPRKTTKNEVCQIGTFPYDYNFKDIEPKYLIGMSVPPVMTAQIANQIRIQWLDMLEK